MKNSYIGQAWLVLALALLFGAALAGVETWLRPRIEANKLAATLKMIPELVTYADAAASAASAKAEPLVITVGEGRDRSQYDVYRAIGIFDDEFTGQKVADQVGWVVKASGKGFTDRIELLVALDPEAWEIIGLRILAQKETPGLGNEIEEVGDDNDKGFLWQFCYHLGIRADVPLTVTTASPDEMVEGSANEIKALSGATISSKSVCKIINEALSPDLRKQLREKFLEYKAKQKAAAEAEEKAAATAPAAAPADAGQE